MLPGEQRPRSGRGIWDGAGQRMPAAGLHSGNEYSSCLVYTAMLYCCILLNESAYFKMEF